MKALINFIAAWIMAVWLVAAFAVLPAGLLTFLPYELFVNDFFGDWVYDPYVWEARVWMAFQILWGIGFVFGLFISYLIIHDKL